MTTFPKAPALVFDIKTVADIEGARRIYPQLVKLNDKDALTALTSLRQQEAGHDFMRLPLQRIVCISMLYVKEGNLTLFSLSADTLSEAQILTKFFRAFKDFATLPQLISWNGSGFDIPVLIYRAMQYDISVPLLFEEGNTVKSMRYDNYVNRFHTRHIDLMDRFSQYGSSPREALHVVASLYALPSPPDIDSSLVNASVSSDTCNALIVSCESNVLTSWLIYLRWLRLTGVLSSNDFSMWQTKTSDYLIGDVLPSDTEGNGIVRHQDYLDKWLHNSPDTPSTSNQ